ncbi:hypothetical protein GKZ28_13225 [Clostridium chromiireducens]|uniref:Uncharacterized protein n=1 Tax=Clostridium chromiireducens TaxID=225345 RepID=A0A964RNA2_9CLOT|nr:hypothetical protein [Clostridium chromiireducens]MVX64655.1 hypothetical protein [Clostridium chromiireducens]
MILGIIIVVIGGLYFYDYIRTRNNPNNNKTLEDYYKDAGYTYINPLIDVKYLGGISDISIKNRIDYTLTKEGLLLLYSDIDQIPVINSKYTKQKLIKWDNIKDISLQTEQSIKEKVSLGKLVCFGIFAFAMSGKEKLSTKEYIIINVNDPKGEYNICLESKDNQNTIEKLNKRIA